MYVSSYLEMHTTLIGWLLYGLSYDLIMQTGLFLLPFLWLLLSNSAQFIMSANQLDTESHAGTRMHISGMLGGLLVIALCMAPIYEIQPTTVTYQPAPSFTDPDPGEVTANADPTTYQENLGQVVQGSGSIRVPIWWRFLHGISTGVTQAIVQNLPTPGDLRHAQNQISSANISDPGIAQEYRSFVKFCYLYAHSVYRELAGKGRLDLSGVDPEDIDWPGSRFLLDMPGGYAMCDGSNGCRSTQWVDPQQTASSDRLPAENVTCAMWWTVIEDRILENDSANDGVWQGLKDGVRQFFGATPEELREERVRGILTNFHSQTISREHESGQGGIVSGIWALVEDGVSTAMLAGKSIETEGYLSLIKQATPMVVAVVQMFVILFLPWAMVFTSYRIDTVVRLSFFLFSLAFVHALLAIAGWLDYYLTTSLFQDYSLFSWLRGDDQHFIGGVAQKRMLINIILGFAYIGVPMLWMSLMTMVGIGAARSASGMLSSASRPTDAVAGGIGRKTSGYAASAATSAARGATTAAGKAAETGVKAVTGKYRY